MRELKYLIIDDSATVRKLVAKTVETKFGAGGIYLASDGLEALEVLKANPIDIIISDWEMPNMAGDELLMEVRNNPKWKDIPFIIMTTHGEKDFLVTAIQLGVSQYIVKPFAPEELEDKVRKSWNSAAHRKAERFAYMPKHELLIKGDGGSFQGTVVNISRTGMLVRLNYIDAIRLFANYDIELKVEGPDKKKTWLIAPLTGRVIRLESDHSIQATSKLCLMALYLDPVTINKKVEETLMDLLNWTNSQIPEVIPIS